MAYINIITFIILALFSMAIGERVSFEDLKKILLKKNLNVKMSQIEVKIAQERYQVERSDLFPTFSISFYNEYLRDLSSSPTYINGQYYIGSTGYSSSMSIKFDFVIFDFGNRMYKLKMYKTSIDASKENLIYTKEKQILTLLDKYYEALINQEKLFTLNKLRYLYIKLFQANQRLYKAGLVSKENVINTAIKLAEISTQLEELKQKQLSVINELSMLVGKELKNPYFENFKETNIKGYINVESLPEVVEYAKKIEEKEYQLRLEKSQFFPNIQLFGRYTLSNFDRTYYIRSIKGLKPVNWRIGFIINITIFDGFKRNHRIIQIKKEIEKLKLKKDLIIKRRDMEIKNSYVNLRHNKIKIRELKKKVKSINEYIEIKKKLYNVGKESNINIIKKQIELINEKLNLKLSMIENLYITKKLNLLREFSFEHGTSSY